MTGEPLDAAEVQNSTFFHTTLVFRSIEFGIAVLLSGPFYAGNFYFDSKYKLNFERKFRNKNFQYERGFSIDASAVCITITKSDVIVNLKE